MDPLSSTRCSRKTTLDLLGAAVGVLLIATALRFVWLDRFPLGWHHDEALMGVMAGAVYRGEDRPIFFQQYLGQEPLYIYASASAMALLWGDQDILPLRLTSATFGILTVALTFTLGRALFGSRVGLLAMALVGGSFWQVMSSRNGYRSITQPFVEAIAVYLLWRARTRRRPVWFVGAGAALGAAFYTYLGARAFPAVFLGFGLWLLATGRRPARHDLARVVLLAAALVVVAAPLAYFFLTHPGMVSARMDQVFIFRPQVNGGHPWAMLADNVAKMLQSFTFAGESLWRYNLPGRPMFVGIPAVAFYVGLIALVAGIRRRDDAAALVVIWLTAMFLPALLSWDVGAYTLRAMGLVPALYLVPAVGLDWLWQTARARGWLTPRLAFAVLIGALVVDGVWTTRDYFVVWATSFGASWEGHADAVAQARFIARNARPDREDIFVGNEYYHHPVLAQLAGPAYPTLRWFNGTQSVVFDPGSPRPALYVLAFSGMPSQVDALFAASARVGAGYFPEGINGGAAPPTFLAYRLAPEEVRSQVDRLLADPRLGPVAGRVPGVLQPLGARLDGPSKPGGELRATMIWHVQGRPPPGDYQLVAQLLDHSWRALSDVEGLGYPVEEWRPDDIVWSQFAIPVPAGTPPGQYKVQLALYNRQSGARLPIVDGVPGIAALILGDVRVVAAEPAPSPDQKLSVMLGSDVELIGFDGPRAEGAPTLAVTLDWRTRRPLSQDYTVFVQLLDPNGKLVAQSDSWPADGALPTTAWLPGEVIRDEHRLALGPDLPSGRYRLIAGLYLVSTGQRLPVSDGADFADLGPVTLPLR